MASESSRLPDDNRPSQMLPDSNGASTGLPDGNRVSTMLLNRNRASSLLPNDVRIYCDKLAAFFRRQNKTVLFGGNQTVSLSVSGFQQVVEAVKTLRAQHAVLDRKLLVDLEYLESVLERLCCLAIYSKLGEDNSAWIQLTGLKALTVLELKDVPLYLVHGLDTLRDQIYTIKMHSCEFNVEDLLSGCLGDSTPPREWKRLATLSISHNRLSRLSSTMNLAPRIHTFSASHNSLLSTEGLSSLESLHTLILSYNQLKNVPSLSPDCTITTLALGYNRLETLNGLERLICLESLDISGNCLMHHDVLAPVSALSRLKQLDTRYNPLSSHLDHRRIASSWLHNDLVHSDFILDTFTLSKAEYLQIGSSRMLSRSQLSPQESDEYRGEGDQDIHQAGRSGGGTVSSFDLESASVTGSREGSMVSGFTQGGRRKKNKKKKVRVAIITDQPSDSEVTDAESKHKQAQSIQPDFLQGSETVRQMALLRSKYGEENWLREKSGETLTQILGLPNENQTTSQSYGRVQQNASLKESTTDNSIRKDDINLVNDKEIKVDSIVRVSKPEAVPAKTSSSTMPSKQSKKSSELSSKVVMTSPAVYGAEDTADLYAMYKQKESSPSCRADECHLPVERIIPGDDSGHTDKLTLAIDKEFIREQKDGEGTRVKWFLHSLEGMDILKCEKGRVWLHLLFNTVKRGRRERMYILTEQNYSKFIAVTAGQLEQIARSFQGLTFLQCIKCQSKFSQENSQNKKTRKKSLEVCCVNCGSNMVIECRAPNPVQHEEEADIGLPAVEALDIASTLNLSVPTTNRKEGNSIPEPSMLTMLESGQQNYRKVSSGNVMNVQADIHDHQIKDPGSSLPDLVPTQAYRKGSSGSGKRGKKSGSNQRSDSSSDISVISDNSIDVLQHEEKSSQGSDRQRSSSPSSIEILQQGGGGERGGSAATTAEESSNSSIIVAADQDSINSSSIVTTDEDCSGEGPGGGGDAHVDDDAKEEGGMLSSGSTMMQESSSSGSLTNSVIHKPMEKNLMSPSKRNERTSEDESLYMTCPSADTTHQSQSSQSNSSNHQDSSTTSDEALIKSSNDHVTAAAGSLTAGDDVITAAGSLTAGVDFIYGTTPTNREDFREITPVAELPKSPSKSSSSPPPPTTPQRKSSVRGFFSSFSSTPKGSPVKRSDSSSSNERSSPRQNPQNKGGLLKRSASDLNQSSSGLKSSASNDDTSDTKSEKFFSAQNSLNSTITGENSNGSEEVERPFRPDKGFMNWNYDDFSEIDHRLRLFCEINLFHQHDEELLLVAKGKLIVKSLEKLLNGILVLSNKNIYILKATREESDEPSDWLSVSCSASITRLHRIIQLLGAQALALELTVGEGKAPTPTYMAAGPYLSRVGNITGGGVGEEDCYYLLLADSNRTKTFIDQTVDILQERVRSNPIPVVRELDQEEKKLLSKQIQRDRKEVDEDDVIQSFHLVINSKGETVSLVVSSKQLILAENLFPWLLLSNSSTKLNIKFRTGFTHIVGMDIYQSMLESVSFILANGQNKHLTFMSEAGLQQFVREFRDLWETETGYKLEGITSFHPTGCKTVLKMTDLMEESVSFDQFDFSQWIKVTSSKDIQS